MEVSSNDGYEFEVLRTYDTLQRVVRNPDYESLCQDLIFDKDGFAQIDTILLEQGERADQEKSLEEIRKTFGLAQPIHPSVILENKYPPEFFSQTPILEKDPFACMLIFHRTTTHAPPEQRAGFAFPGSDDDETIVLSPIHDGHYIILDIDLLAPVKAIKSAVKEYIDVYRECLPMGLQGGEDAPACRCLSSDADSGRFKVNMLAYEKDILGRINKHVIPPTERAHFEKRNGCYLVFDRKKERKPFWAIALQLGLTEDQARKRFDLAFRLITGESCKTAIWKEVMRKHLLEKVKKLDGKEQEKAYEDLLRLEEVGRKERLLTKKELKREAGTGSARSPHPPQESPLYDDSDMLDLLATMKEKVCQEDCSNVECEAYGLSNPTLDDIMKFRCDKIRNYLKN